MGAYFKIELTIGHYPEPHIIIFPKKKNNIFVLKEETLSIV
jgi:hypothetical protein